jgi:hypothetical protein
MDKQIEKIENKKPATTLLLAGVIMAANIILVIALFN